MAALKTDEKKVDRRVAKTRKAIMAAFDSLLAKNEMKDITVSSIAREADIDRKTFYLHYPSSQALIDAKSQEIISHIVDSIVNTQHISDLQQRTHAVIGEVNTTLESNKALFRHFADYISVDYALEQFEHTIRPALERVGINEQTINDYDFHMKLRYNVAGAISLYGCWIKNQDDMPVERVSAVVEEAFVKLFTPLAPNGVACLQKASQTSAQAVPLTARAS